jgi:hypothetical protein
MFRNVLTGTAITCVLAFGFPAGAFAQDDAKRDVKQAGAEAKDAGKDAGAAAKDAGKATAKRTKKAAKKTGQVAGDAANETATGTKKAAKSVKRKLTPDTTSSRCQDGTVQTGKTKTTACVDHGGVQG